jgi:hypothetical protein
MTPITVSPLGDTNPGVAVGGPADVVAVAGPGVVGAPQVPQNRVVSLTEAPQLPQNFPNGWAGAGTEAMDAPHIPQNFSGPLIGLPHEGQTADEAAAGVKAGDGGGGDTEVTVADGWLSATLTRHLLQNLSPGLMIFPHARQVRVPD